jgi:hypothetical protein
MRHFAAYGARWTTLFTGSADERMCEALPELFGSQLSHNM